MSIGKRLENLERTAAVQSDSMESESLRQYRRELLAHPELLELLRAANAGDMTAKAKFDARVRELGLTPPHEERRLTREEIRELYRQRELENDPAAATALAGPVQPLRVEA